LSPITILFLPFSFLLRFFFFCPFRRMYHWGIRILSSLVHCQDSLTALSRCGSLDRDRGEWALYFTSLSGQRTGIHSSPLLMTRGQFFTETWPLTHLGCRGSSRRDNIESRKAE
jgi:hypothetical protein